MPRPADVPWDDRIPYPVFAIGAHLLLRDCTAADGPTAVVPGSHRSGRLAPADRLTDPDLSYDGRPPVLSRVEPATWPCSRPMRGTAVHLRPAATAGCSSRCTTRAAISPSGSAPPAEVNHLGAAAIARAVTDRQRTLAGLHQPYFYDG